MTIKEIAASETDYELKSTLVWDLWQRCTGRKKDLGPHMRGPKWKMCSIVSLNDSIT